MHPGEIKPMRIVMKAVSVIALVLLLSISGQQIEAQDKLHIVATTTQASDLVRIIAGDLVELTPLMGAGVDPHLYQPTEANIAAMNVADVVIYSGLHLEGQFDVVFEGLGERDVVIYRLSESVETAGFVLDAPASLGTRDPHFWFDPRNWQLVTEDFAELMSELDPDNAATYQANAEAYIEQLGLLYDWGVEGMMQVAEEQRYLVTSHDAFQYFGDAFGWEMVGIQGVSTEDEAGVGDIQGIVDFVKANQIPVMFVESSVPPSTIEAVQAAVGLDENGEPLVGIGARELYSDAMGEPGTFGGTYIGMTAANVITILLSYEMPIPEYPAELQPALPDELLEIVANVSET
jgi:manganese/zinc/iron transport system substrate-binding protein